LFGRGHGGRGILSSDGCLLMEASSRLDPTSSGGPAAAEKAESQLEDPPNRSENP
jgi:hypothetical protein